MPIDFGSFISGRKSYIIFRCFLICKKNLSTHLVTKLIFKNGDLKTLEKLN